MSNDRNEIATPGGSIGARIGRLISDAIVHTRQRLAKTQSDVAKEVFNDVTNHISDEVRAAMGNIFRTMANHPDTPPEVKPLLHHLGYSRGQGFGWIGGAATGAAMSSGLGDLLTNSLAPVISSIIAANPNAFLSPEQSATLEARRITRGWDNQREAARRGVSGDRFRLLARLSQRDLDRGEVYELYNRGILSHDDAIEELIRGGVSEASARKTIGLAKVPLTPEQAAQAWARNLVSEGLVHLASRSAGLTNEDGDVLMGLAGEPPAPDQLMLAWRRGIITESDVDRGIVQGPIRNEWIPVVKSLFEQPLPPTEAGAAVTQGHLSLEQGRAKAALSGISAEDFSVIVENSGIPPGLQFAIDAVNRKVITREQFTSMFLESRIKNKYIDLMLAMSQTLVPAETVRVAYRLGVYPKDKALETLAGHGYSATDAQALLAVEDVRAREGTKDLTRAQILDLFGSDIIAAEEASNMLGDLGFDSIEVQWMITLEEGQKVKRFVNALTTRVRNGYVSGNLDEEEAASLLDRAGVGNRQRDNLIALWDIERESLSANLTPAQIVAAAKKGLIDEAEGKDRLVARGYTEQDAEILIRLSIPA
jgi:hypothetical protein